MRQSNNDKKEFKVHTDKTIFGSSQLFEMSCAIHAICLLLKKSKIKSNVFISDTDSV